MTTNKKNKKVLEKESQISNYEKEKTKNENNLKEKRILTKHLVELEKLKKESENADGQYEQSKKDIADKKEKTKKLEIDLASLKNEIENLNLLIKKIEKFGKICPITEEKCSELSVDIKGQLLDSKNKKKIELTNEISSKTKEFEILSKEVFDLENKQNKIFETIKQKNQIVTQISQISVRVNNIENAESNLKEKEKLLETYLKEHEKELEEFDKLIAKATETIKIKNEKIKTLKEKIVLKIEQELQELNTELAKINEKLKYNTDLLRKVENEIAIYNSKLEKIKEIKIYLDKIFEENEKLVLKKKTFLELTKIFGKDGIQKSVMKQSIPFLEKSSNEILTIFNNDSNKIKITFDLDPRTASGELKKGGGLDILVIEEGKEPKDLVMYSGGERIRLVFSIIFGLAKLLSIRSGKKHETLIIDEKIAKLDRKGIEQFTEILEIISSWYKKIFVITHIESLKDMIGEFEVLVNKTDEGSLVTIR